MRFADLFSAITAVCPLLNLSGSPSDRTTWAVTFAPGATDEQKAQARALLDACEPDPAPPAPPRSATASQLYAVMTSAQTTAWDKAVEAQKLAYQAYWFGGYRDPMPETNGKLAKIAKAAGVDLKALYDTAVAQPA